MTSPSRSRLVDSLLDRHGRTYSAEAGIKLDRPTPSPLFRLLCLSLLLGARIRADVAVAASRALSTEGWRTPRRLAEATWEDRTHVLNAAGYARYDESTSRMLGEGADLLLARWHGDLRELREEANRDPSHERRLLKELKGIGDVSADIFLREVQGAWDEVRPFVGDRALTAANKLGIATTETDVAELVPESRLPTLVAALIRLSLAGDYDEVKTLAL